MNLRPFERAIRLVAFLLFVMMLSCASSTPRKSRFEREFERYLSLPNQKAMAIAGDPNLRWVCGYGYASASKGLAQDAALEQCNTRKRSLGPDASCVIYAIGNDVVWKTETVENPE
jgi:hypothetical protein